MFLFIVIFHSLNQRDSISLRVISVAYKLLKLETFLVVQFNVRCAGKQSIKRYVELDFYFANRLCDVRVYLLLDQKAHFWYLIIKIEFLKARATDTINVLKMWYELAPPIRNAQSCSLLYGVQRTAYTCTVHAW